jgi:hypothetical protein
MAAELIFLDTDTDDSVGAACDLRAAGYAVELMSGKELAKAGIEIDDVDYQVTWGLVSYPLAGGLSESEIAHEASLFLEDVHKIIGDRGDVDEAGAVPDDLTVLADQQAKAKRHLAA